MEECGNDNTSPFIRSAKDREACPTPVTWRIGAEKKEKLTALRIDMVTHLYQKTCRPSSESMQYILGESGTRRHRKSFFALGSYDFFSFNFPI